MSQTITITATPRQGAGKGVNRKLRSKGIIPAVVYGHNYDAVSLCIDSGEMNKMFRPGHEDMQDYQLYKLVINGSETRETMVVIKNIQREPIKEQIRHMDFFAVRMDEKIIAPVHVRITGKSIGVKNGGILRHILHEIKVKSLPADVPPHIDIDVSAMEIGASIHVKDLQLPANVQIISDAEAGVVNIMAPTVVKEEKADEAAAAPADAKAAAAPAAGKAAPAAGKAAPAAAAKAAPAAAKAAPSKK
jgi:large subunit ribosomal protein L25